ncbi:MerR family transcriptional regulator [Bacillus sp. PS06]|uniref:MerR family transcriptional regulator n=1 Tax=Bacillus sp. PS06 TaxID=2764176 RepID=UPI0017848BF7|nr:MerR family transcriptional regulator [Bacillus sp. PS06]MBD8070281.1 MerR family transcriptional regulator [Bacillus sp. PS06]
MGSQEGKYNIKAMTKMLGIQAGTLRAWERRYKIIAPKRNESGHRLYTEEHVQILSWLVEKVNKGFTISQAISLLESSPALMSSLNEEHRLEFLLALQNELVDSLIHFNEHKAHELMNKAFSIYTIDKVVIELLSSTLIQIGTLWEEGEITSAHERFASSFIRSKIGMIFHNLPVNSMLPKAVTACGPGEFHEIGLSIFTLFLRLKGFEVIYIGTSTAEGDLEIVIDEINPNYLFISCTMEENKGETLKLVERITKKNRELTIGLGGNAFTKNKTHTPPIESIIVGDQQSDWEQWLKEKMNQVN